MFKMTVPEAFLIVIDDVISLYLLASPYSCTGIKQLLQICIYMLFRVVSGYPGIELLKFLGGIIESRETQDRQWSLASKFSFCKLSKLMYGEDKNSVQD